MKGKATFKLSGFRAKHWRGGAQMKGAEMGGAPALPGKKPGRKNAAKPWAAAGKLWGRNDSL